jgi:hypothetical protein
MTLISEMVSLKLLYSSTADDEVIDAWLSVRGLQIARVESRSIGGLTGPRNGLGRPAWADRPRPISAQSATSFARRWFPSLLDPSPFCMWALVVSFSLSWTKLLVLQDSTLFCLGPRSLSSSRVWSLGFLESCLLHCMTCTGLQGLVTRCLMNLSWKSYFQC